MTYFFFGVEARPFGERGEPAFLFTDDVRPLTGEAADLAVEEVRPFGEAGEVACCLGDALRALGEAFTGLLRVTEILFFFAEEARPLWGGDASFSCLAADVRDGLAADFRPLLPDAERLETDGRATITTSSCDVALLLLLWVCPLVEGKMARPTTTSSLSFAAWSSATLRALDLSPASP